MPREVPWYPESIAFLAELRLASSFYTDHQYSQLHLSPGKLNHEAITEPIKTVYSILDQISGKNQWRGKRREGRNEGGRES